MLAGNLLTPAFRDGKNQDKSPLEQLIEEERKDTAGTDFKIQPHQVQQTPKIVVNNFAEKMDEEDVEHYAETKKGGN